MLAKYVPETAAEKKVRLAEKAKAKAEGKEVKDTAAPITVKFGINHVTKLIEMKKAKFVLIADDVDPIDLVMWMPALCRKMGVPFAIVKGKAKLGALVHQKNATCVCLTSVRREDEAQLNTLKESWTSMYEIDNHRHWGGGIMGLKTQRKLAIRAAAIAAERKKKGLM